MAKAKKHPHERLGITFQEYGALLGVREMLKNGALVHTRARWPVELDEGVTHGFNMQIACHTSACASVGCIGGSMALLMGYSGPEAEEYVGIHDHPGTHSPTLRPLFFPPGSNWYAVTEKVAMRAIDNFLKDGKPRWSKLLPRK